jgi:hypothetical protein
LLLARTFREFPTGSEYGGISVWERNLERAKTADGVGVLVTKGERGFSGTVRETLKGSDG